MVSGNRGIRQPWTWLSAIILSVMLLLSGCDDIHRYTIDAIKAIDNDYFKTKVVYESKDGSVIIQNEITGEYFLVIEYPYGVDLTPIQMSEMVVNPDDDGDDGTSSPLSEEDYCNSNGF